LRRWFWRRHVGEQRAQLADDVRRLAGFADAAAETATRLGADVPEGVAACAVVWHHWAWRLAEWARGGEPQ
jgi:predicted RNA methylase